MTEGTENKDARLAFKSSGKTVMIGAHFPVEVRRALMQLQANQYAEGKNLKELLGEAINDLCAKYGEKPPYKGDAAPEAGDWVAKSASGRSSGKNGRGG